MHIQMIILDEGYQNLELIIPNFDANKRYRIMPIDNRVRFCVLDRIPLDTDSYTQVDTDGVFDYGKDTSGALYVKVKYRNERIAVEEYNNA